MLNGVNLNLNGYTISKKLWESLHSTVYRGIRESDKQNIVIKLLSNEHPSLEEIARFEQEYAILKLLQGNGTVIVFSFDKLADTRVIVEEDGGSSLQELLSQRKLSLKEFLNFALKITEALEVIHNAHIIHKDINPANIVYSLAKQKIKIIDFGMATTLSREVAEIRNIELMQEGTLLYISPEQTGRMNRGIDYRTDFYSLGITFYQMATGTLPFQSKDMAEIIHAHIAKLPIPPHEIEPSLPEVVSEIILKLIAKRAEDRYQSLYGLKTDLQKCVDQLNQNGDVLPFRIGEKDISSYFQIPEKLYGREEQLSCLLSTFDQAAIGKAQLLLVAGYSGIGKSSLVHELYKPLTEKRGYFISGKFDQYKRNVPYSAIIQALQGLIQQLLTVSEEKLQIWRDKIQKALHPNGRILTDLIPILTAIIGEQPPVPELGATENKNRFEFVFKSFIQNIAQMDHPIALFLDDCQWADISSLNLLETILLTQDMRHLLVITAYRDNEVNQNHIFDLWVEKLKDAKVISTKIALPPLQLTDVQRLIADTMNFDLSTIQDLAEICYEKTVGNPFFLAQFLQRLYIDELIQFNSLEGKWQWDIQRITQEKITDNVIELMSQKIKKLSTKNQHILAMAACFGSRFDLETLSIICELSPKQISQGLYSALSEGLIQTLEGGYQFLHDRIQQAAYLLIEEDTRNRTHLTIGRLLLQHTPKEKLSEIILDIVNHLNLGADLITDPDEKVKVAELNLAAGKKAMASAAFKAAFDYFKSGIYLLEKNSWELHYDLTLALYTQAVETAHLSFEAEQMKLFAETALLNAKQLLDKVKIYNVQISYLFMQNKLNESLQLGLHVLNLFGIKLPLKPSTFQVILSLIRVKWALRGKSIEDLLNLPKMTDPYYKALISFTYSINSVAYCVSAKLLLLLNLTTVLFSLKHGNDDLSSLSYVMYGLTLSVGFKQIKLGYEFGQLALRLVEKSHNETVRGHIWFMTSLLLPNQDHLDNSLALLNKAYQKTLETGDEIHGIRILAVNILFYIFGGKPLDHVIRDTNKCADIMRRADRTITQYMSVSLQIALNLIGSSEETTELVSATCDERILLPKMEATGDTIGFLGIYTAKLFLGYIFNDYKLAYNYGTKMMAYISQENVSFLLGTKYLFYSLTCLALYTNVSKSEQKKLLRIVNNNQKEIKFWMKHAPLNFLNKYHLVEAEVSRVLNKLEQASDHYDRAIQLSKENGFIHEAAIANECAARFYLLRNKELIARVYLQEAHYYYSQWGALAKVRQLEQNYSYLLKMKQGYSRNFSEFSISMSRTNMSGSMASMFDLSSIMKSTQTITREIELAALLKKMMSITIENAGAQIGYLLLEKSGTWYIEAKASIEQQEVTVLQSIPIRNVLPETIIQYVIRSKVSLTLDNAGASEQFKADPYILRVKPKSVLCMPLLNQGALNGVLYLENNLATAAFTKERMDILNVLLGQIVSAIDNAKLYSHLQELNRAQASFVPKELLNLLGKKDITEVKLGDQVQQEMTVLFCDMRNFTSISEALTPEEIMIFINNFLAKMEPIITEHHGVIDKYIGDAIMALFPSNVDDAVRGSIAMLKALQNYNADRLKKSSNAVPIEMGIGLNTGLLVLGTVGTSYRMEGTVLSDAVNIASRTETLTKTYHVPLLITEDTYKKLKDPRAYGMRKIDNSVFVKGKSVPIVIYEIFDHEPDAITILKYKTLSEFEKGVELFWQNKHAQALEIFHHIFKLNPDDLASKLYIEKCKTKEKPG